MILRELFVHLGLDVDAASFASGQAAVEIVKASLGKLVEFGKDIIEHISDVSEYGTKIREMSQITGIAADDLQRLGKAASSEGIGIDALGHSMIILSRTMAAAKGGSEESAKAFSGIGVHIKDANGKLRSASDVFSDIQAKLSKMPDGAEKTALALKLMGRSGAEMIPLLNMSAEEMEKFKHASVMSAEDIAASKEITQIQIKLGAVTKALWKDAIGPLLPAIRDLLKRFLEWKKASAEIMKVRIKEYVGYLIKALNALGDAFDFLSEHANLVKIFLMGLAAWFLIVQSAGIGAAIATAAAWIVAALPFVLIALAIAALALILDDLVSFMKGEDSVIGDFISSVFGEGKSAELIHTLQSAWESVTAVIKEGYEWVMKHMEAIKEVANVIWKITTAPLKAAQAVSGAIGDTLAKGANAAEMAFGEGAGTTEGSTKMLQTPEQFKEAQRMKYIKQNDTAYVAQGGIGPSYVPPTSGAGASGGAGGVQNNVNVTVHAAPGMSPEAVGKIVVDKFSEHGVVTGDHLEAAAAAAGG